MYSGKNIYILGMGKSGIASSKLLIKNNHVTLTDIKCDDYDLINELESLGINVIITKNQAEILEENFDYVIKNPAISDDNEVIKKAKKLNIPVINEMEVAYNMLPKNVKIVGITGSNGKTTTTALTYEILKLAGLPVKMGGNIGIAFCSFAEDVKEGDILVLEVSSHQLVNLENFKTNISVLTNLSEVHLDMFKTYENYKNNKLKIFNHHTKNDIAILNKNDEDVLTITKNIPSKKLYFSNAKKADCYIKNNRICYKDEEICELSDIRIKGMHNYENVMCAILIAKQFNVKNEIIKEALNNFCGVAHRMEFVKRINEIEFYNDSKATNNKSTIVALSSFNTPVNLILGGLDRGQSFDELKEHLTHVKHIICYGETKEKIKKFCEKTNINVTVVDDLEEATRLAYNLSEEGDTVLLSPACASWDQFKSFEERGNKFKEIIESLR